MANQGEDMRIVYAKPVSKTAAPEDIKRIFRRYGRVAKVHIRREQSTLELKNSVYVEFEEPQDAEAAVRDPPLAIGSSSIRMVVILKKEYIARQQRFQVSRAVTADESVGLSEPSRGRKRPSSTSPSEAQEANLRAELDAQRQRIEELEKDLEHERQSGSRAHSQLMEAKRKEEEAVSARKISEGKLMERLKEVASLNGQLDSLKAQLRQANERTDTQHRARIRDLEAHVHQLKESLAAEKARHIQRPQKLVII